jgi:hypothetical protein
MPKNRILIDLPLNYEAAIAVVSLKLAGAGIYVEPTFEIDSACAPFTIKTCPHSGASPCPCKLVVLKIYEDLGPRMAVIVHSHENSTEFWEEVLPVTPNPMLAYRVRRLLVDEKEKLKGAG